MQPPEDMELSRIREGSVAEECTNGDVQPDDSRNTCQPNDSDVGVPTGLDGADQLSRAAGRPSHVALRDAGEQPSSANLAGDHLNLRTDAPFGVRDRIASNVGMATSWRVAVCAGLAAA